MADLSDATPKSESVVVIDARALGVAGAVAYANAIARDTIAFAGCDCNFVGFTVCLAHRDADA